jgi:carbon-monoxide dehydrogenase medium subunit
MKPAPFEYLRPDSVGEALRLLAETPGARVLAGGQSLVPLMNFRQAQPSHLVDINRLAELDYLHDAGSHLAIGAMTRQRTVEYSALAAARLPLVVAAVCRLGHRQTRNRGTVGGSLSFMDPAAELALTACIHDGELVLRSQRQGERTLPMAAFALGPHRSALEADELLTEVRLVPWPAGHGWGFHEFSRRHADWSIATAAVLLTLDAAGRIERVAVAIGAVENLPPRRLHRIEARLLGHRPAPALFSGATADLAGELQPHDDVAAPAWYRAHMAQVLVRRALDDAARRAATTTATVAEPEPLP